MHTEFVIKGKKITSGFNMVNSGFITSFRAGGNIFKWITIYYKVGEISLSANLVAEHLSTTYLGSGKVCFAFQCKFNGDGAEVTSIAFKSEDGSIINVAQVDDMVIEGEVTVLANAYAKIQGGVTFTYNPTSFFEYLFGLKQCSLTAFLQGDECAYGGVPVSVSVDRDEEALIFNLNLPDGAIGKNIVFFCDKAPVFKISADLKRVGTANVQPVNRVLSVDGGVEITEKAGSAVSVSDVTVHLVASSVGGEEIFPLPFNFNLEKVVCNASGNAVAIKHPYGLGLVLKGERDVCVSPFKPALMDSGIKSFCISGEEAFILSKKLTIVSIADGSVTKEFELSKEFEEVFAFDNSVILCDKDGFCIYTIVNDTLNLSSSNPVENGRYVFDEESLTLTVITKTGIFQYVFTGGTFVTTSTEMQTGIDSALCYGGRLGRCVLVFEDFVRDYNLLDGVQKDVTYAGSKKIYVDRSGTFLSVYYGNYTDVLVFSSLGYTSIGRVETTSQAIACAYGVILSNGKFCPYPETKNLFEATSAVVANSYTAYKETAYFSANSVLLTFEAVV